MEGPKNSILKKIHRKRDRARFYPNALDEVFGSSSSLETSGEDGASCIELNKTSVFCPSSTPKTSGKDAKIRSFCEIFKNLFHCLKRANPVVEAEVMKIPMIQVVKLHSKRGGKM